MSEPFEFDDAARLLRACRFHMNGRCKHASDPAACSFTHLTKAEVRATADMMNAARSIGACPHHVAGVCNRPCKLEHLSPSAIAAVATAVADTPATPPGAARPATGGAGTTASRVRPVAAVEDDDVFEVVLSFDTTGSMYTYLEGVKACIKTTVDDLRARLATPARGGARASGGARRSVIRFGIIAHGDYCDKDTTYVLKSVPFTTDGDVLKAFVDACGATGGGDADECYELALHTASKGFKWTPSSRFKAVVLFGDANPHAPDYALNTHKHCWRTEARSLKEQGIPVFTVHCGGSSASKPFYTELAELTGGQYLTMDGASNISQLIAGLCLKAASEEHFAEYSRALEKAGKRDDHLHRQLSAMTFHRSVAGTTTVTRTTTTTTTMTTTAVASGRGAAGAATGGAGTRGSAAAVTDAPAVPRLTGGASSSRTPIGGKRDEATVESFVASGSITGGRETTTTMYTYASHHEAMAPPAVGGLLAVPHRHMPAAAALGAHASLMAGGHLESMGFGLPGTAAMTHHHHLAGMIAGGAFPHDMLLAHMHGMPSGGALPAGAEGSSSRRPRGHGKAATAHAGTAGRR